ncbi:MAG: sigma-70 family RNA polymerase sigma factor [Pirellulaceae bacterium]|nr:sigma-70 family RNA polymerase sigma factor [Pirellulaceae bacterium]
MDPERRETESRQQFTQLWLQAEPSVSAYVFATISGFHDAEDVVQQIAQELARRFEQYDPDRPFLGWALWIAKSRVIDFYRRRKRDQIVFSDELLVQLCHAIAERAAQRNERREALEHCLEQLPQRSRHLLDLRYVEELPASRIATVTDSTAGSVRVLLTRVRVALAACIHRRLAAEGG